MTKVLLISVLSLYSSLVDGQDCKFNNLSEKFDFKVLVLKAKGDDGFDEVKSINVEVYDKGWTRKISYFKYAPNPSIQFSCDGRSHNVKTGNKFSGEDGDYGDIIVMDINFDGNDDIVIKRDYGRVAFYNYYIQVGYGSFVYSKFLSEEVYGFPSMIDPQTTSLHFVYPAGALTIKRDIVKFDKVSKHWYLDKSIEEKL